MNRKVKFGADVGYLITDFTIKQSILDYLYSSINLSKYRFTILNNVSSLEFLKENKHYVMPNFKGFNYFLIFITLNNIKYCVAIDRRKLSYHKDQNDLKIVFMVKLKIVTSEMIFNGTIFDGKLIESNNKFVFLIQNCFYLMGKPMLAMDMKEKTTHLDDIMKTNFNGSCDNCTFKLNKLYEYDDLPELVNNVIPSCTYAIQGLIFYPKCSGISIIHIEKIENKINIETTQKNTVENKTYDLISNYVNYLNSRTYSYEKNSKTKKLYLSKSNIPDVYNIREKEDSERLGIAHIPSLKISHLCAENIKDNQMVRFNCVYHTKFKKWIPINIIV
jgi:hypothetical protein